MDKPKTVFDSSLEKEKEKRDMIVKKIRALKEVTLNTRVQVKSLVEGEVADVAFYDEKQFKALQAFGNFVEAQPEEPYGRDIPVLLPIEDIQFDEIPIEQQDENKPELKLDKVIEKEINEPTVEELNEILNKGEDIPIVVLSNGEIRAGESNQATVETLEEIEKGEIKTVKNTEQLFKESDESELGDKNETSSDLSPVEGINDTLVSLGEQLEQEYNQDKK